MASQGFSFPPPPPPPPQQQQQQQQASGYANAAPSYGSYNGYPQRGGYRGGGNFNNRGRGRGGMNRGGRGGGGYTNNNYRNQLGGGGGGGYNGYSPAPSVSAQTPVTASTYYGNAAHQQSQPYASTAQPYSHTPASTYPPTNYDGRHNPNSTSQTMGYGNNLSATQAQPGAAPTRGLPGVVAPPMRWGYDSSTGTGGFYPGSTNGTGYNAQQSYAGHANVQGGTGYKNSGHKRTYSSSFEKPTSTVPRAPAPPAVPSFGVPLPAKPPLPTDASRKMSKKKKRKFNQLGLTPKTDEHESSGEEDDVDEEARFAASTANPGGPLEFTFRGRTSHLNTAADIQSWIEERKKKFPTQARVEEKKKAQEEARKQRELQREEARRKQQEAKQRTAPGTKALGEQEVDPMDAAAKAKWRADKLRKKLHKEEKRLQKAEADAERARLMAEASQRGQDVDIQATEEDTKDAIVADNSTAKHPASIEPPALSPIQGDNQDESGLSDDIDTSDDDDEDDAPEEASSRRDGPERVPPPPRGADMKRKKPCHNFQRRGRCPRGDRCRYSHDIPGPGDKSRSDASAKRPAVRRGLFQMLVKQELEARDGQVMQAISWLGSQGLLESCNNIAKSAST